MTAIYKLNSSIEFNSWCEIWDKPKKCFSSHNEWSSKKWIFFRPLDYHDFFKFINLTQHAIQIMWSSVSIFPTQPLCVLIMQKEHLFYCLTCGPKKIAKHFLLWDDFDHSQFTIKQFQWVTVQFSLFLYGPHCAGSLFLYIIIKLEATKRRNFYLFCPARVSLKLNFKSECLQKFPFIEIFFSLQMIKKKIITDWKKWERKKMKEK